MKLIDRIHTEHPSFGVLRLQDELSEHNLFINHKRVRLIINVFDV
ncbi:MAG: transposase [Bacteroidetes bacterium]|nr:transposase [Bacteroidota bacterium]